MMSDHVLLWRDAENAAVRCVMISCRTGAGLQMRRGDEIVRRELYPDKLTVYGRARQLYADLIAGRSRSPG